MIRYIRSEIPAFKRSVACIGFFDCVHRGHQELISMTIRLARKKQIRSALICFDPDPVDIILGKKSRHILSFKDRLNKISEFGIDDIYVICFDAVVMKKTPVCFVNDYLNKMNLDTLVCGFDYSFGYKGEGDPELLKRIGEFTTVVIKEKTFYKEKISSTRIRKAISEGNYRLVNRLLGWNYYLSLKVNKSLQINNRQCLECTTLDPQIILPEKDYRTDDYFIHSGKIYIYSDVEIQKGEKLILPVV